MKIEHFINQYVQNSQISKTQIKEYIFNFVSVGVARKLPNQEEVQLLYQQCISEDYMKKSPRIEKHRIVKSGSIELELLAQKILVVLQCGEVNRKVKLKMDSIIKTIFSEVYEAAREQNREILKQHYMRMDIRTRKEEARFDAAVYFFLSVHDVWDRVDYQSLLSILCDIEDYELSWKEYEKSMLEKKQIQAVDIPERELFGRKRNKDIEMIMKFHGMEASLLFNEDSWHSNELLLALNIEQDLKDSRYNKEEIVKNLFFYELLGKYQEIRDYVVSRELNQRDIEVKEEYEEKLNQLQEEKCHIEEEKRRVEVEKKRLMDENYGLKEKMKEIDLVYRGEINQLKRQHQLEIMNYQKNIQESVKELRYLKSATKVEERLNTTQSLTIESKLELFNILEHMTLVIIGGSKEWRRKLRERFPGIRFLNGFNENFDEIVLEKADLILFFPRYMNHATYYKAMNIIKVNEKKHNYIEKTNMDLVEMELYSKIRQYGFEFDKIRVEM